MKKAAFGLFIIVFASCIRIKEQYTVLAPGIWRGVLELEPPTIKANTGEPADSEPENQNDGVYLPFLFEIKYQNDLTWQAEFINGTERIVIDHVNYGRNPYSGRDTITIFFDLFDSYLTGEVNEGIMVGKWVRSNRTSYEIPFVAHFGEEELFPHPVDSAQVDISGKWESYFEIETDHPYPAIGLFEQTGNALAGTFLTETGDYRYLAGSVHGSDVNLAVFDGAHAFLFKGKLQSDHSLLGTYWSGHRYKTLWKAKKNASFELTHPDSLTYITNRGSFDQLSFKDLNGQKIGFGDKSLEGKIKVVQIMGTWCPNCLDETKFLVEYINQHPHPNLAIVGLAFESYTEDAKNIERLKIYKDKLKVPYSLWLAGNYQKSEASKVLPFLNEVTAFPTLIFLDKNNQVQKIHTGFNGPATPLYEEFTSQFAQTVQSLLKSI